jgi:hypothetical protein
MSEVEVYENPNKEISKPSKLWYLLPILFGIIGGIIGYFLIRDRDRRMAKNVIICAIAILVVQIILSFSILAFYGLTAPSGELKPQASGFENVYIISPWEVRPDGNLKFYLENRADSEISIRKIYTQDTFPVNREITPYNLQKQIAKGERSDLITINTGIKKSSGDTYLINISIEYCFVNQNCNEYFNSTGILGGHVS